VINVTKEFENRTVVHIIRNFLETRNNTDVLVTIIRKSNRKTF